MAERIKSYKLSAQLKASLGTRPRGSLKFYLPNFKLPKLPAKGTIITAVLIVALVGAYLGAKKTYDYLNFKTEQARAQQEREYKVRLAQIENELKSQAQDAFGYVELSQKYLKDGDGERAEAAARQAVEKDPLWADGYANLGQVYLSLNKFDQARGALETALAKDPLNGQTHYLLSLTYQELKNSEGAKTEFAKAKAFGFETEIGG